MDKNKIKLDKNTFELMSRIYLSEYKMAEWECVMQFLHDIRDKVDKKIIDKFRIKYDRARRLVELYEECVGNKLWKLDWKWLYKTGRLCGNDLEIFNLKFRKYYKMSKKEFQKFAKGFK